MVVSGLRLGMDAPDSALVAAAGMADTPSAPSAPSVHDIVQENHDTEDNYLDDVRPRHADDHTSPCAAGDHDASAQADPAPDHPAAGSHSHHTAAASRAGSGSRPGPSGVVNAFDPSASTPPSSDKNAIDSSNGSNAGPGESKGSGGLSPGATAGLVVALILLLLLIFFAFRYRRRLRDAVSKFRGSRFDRIETPGPDNMGRQLITPVPPAGSPPPAGPSSAPPSQQPQQKPSAPPPMRQHGAPNTLLIPAAAARRDSNRVSIFSDTSTNTAGFTPSPVSPASSINNMNMGGNMHIAGAMLSPGAVHSSRPVQEPPDPRAARAQPHHVSRGSVSTISTVSAISAALSPGQMAWPMPPGTPPAIKHPDGGAAYIDFERQGETVVKITQPKRSHHHQRSGGY
ncbi:hypothetical protein VTJ49DRAFT_950 [Mycothermus thermophilus]|uniref:Uncharacterized protein n=1 Tax=Humicola insolens TaxID=85995 RepID=A0ABR3VEP6_HUMIN